MPRIIRGNEWAETCAAENCMAAWLCSNFDAKRNVAGDLLRLKKALNFPLWLLVTLIIFPKIQYKNRS